jgi:hypothetical protein
MPHRPLALAAAALLTLAGCGGDSKGGGGGPALDPGKAALLANTAYVDYDTTTTFAEASNVEMAMLPGANLWGVGANGLGLDVRRFLSVTGPAIREATAGRRILVIPELERGNPAPDMDFDAITALREHVNAGGLVLLFLPDPFSIPLADAILGTALQPGYPPNFQEPAALSAAGSAGTPFAAGPPSIQANDGSSTLLTASLPPGARSIYTVGGDSLVTVFPKGPGFVVFLGWDWFIDLLEETPDVANWVDVLRRSTQL